MTKNKLNKANEIDMKIRRLENYKKFAENFKDKEMAADEVPDVVL